MTERMRRIVLASRPAKAASEDNFRIETALLPAPGDGEVLVRVHYISLDPYMRGRMDDAESYAASVPVGGIMGGGGVGEVIASNHPDFRPGDFAFGMFGWTTHACESGNRLRRLDPSQAPIGTALGVLGMPGFTGWFGLNELGRPKSGETLVVAAATGPVGSMVGQLARLAGLRTVGIAGGAAKCALATGTFGFDACIDHRAHDSARELRGALAQACPGGIDIYFENVGGKVLEAVIPLMNEFGRIPVCGMISWYDAGGLGAGAASEGLPLPALWSTILKKFLSVNGFIISNHYDRFAQFLADVAPKLASGEIRYLEDVTEGLENTPAAFLSMLKGDNTGKQLVRLV
ncbi:MAG: NADP-dependent oxidoreductase [Jhaorihella sp.]